MKKIIIIILIAFYYTDSLACDCIKISKHADLIASDYVLIGEIIEVGKLFFKIKSYEFFKGQQIDTLIANIDVCSINPNKGELWLFYAFKTNSDKIYVSQCNSSRSFNNPYSFNIINLPLPPPSNIDESTLKLLDELNKNKALLELQYDIATLRDHKIQDNLQGIQENILGIKSQLILFKWGFALSIILIIFLIIVTIKKNKDMSI